MRPRAHGLLSGRLYQYRSGETEVLIIPVLPGSEQLSVKIPEYTDGSILNQVIKAVEFPSTSVESGYSLTISPLKVSISISVQSIARPSPLPNAKTTVLIV